jgi:hypothetical protein
MNKSQVSIKEIKALWESHLGSLYNTQQLYILTALPPQVIYRQIRQNILLALKQKNGRYFYPAFQFNSQGDLKKGFSDIFSVFPLERCDRYTIASWFVSPQPKLKSHTPVEWLDSGGSITVLYKIAQRVAARLKQ